MIRRRVISTIRTPWLRRVGLLLGFPIVFLMVVPLCAVVAGFRGAGEVILEAIDTFKIAWRGKR